MSRKSNTLKYWLTCVSITVVIYKNTVHVYIRRVSRSCEEYDGEWGVADGHSEGATSLLYIRHQNQSKERGGTGANESPSVSQNVGRR